MKASSKEGGVGEGKYLKKCSLPMVVASERVEGGTDHGYILCSVRGDRILAAFS